jgi:hypothetical protein
MMSNILHDWTDEQCLLILENCRRVMEPDARLLVVEMIIPPANEPSIAKFLDLEMLVTTGGRERTQAEFQDLFESAGLKLSRVISTHEGTCVIEGIRM